MNTNIMKGLSCLLALALAGCGSEVLDFRNAEIVNGKIYKKGANEPFTGKVTNIPDITILRPQQGIVAPIGTIRNILSKDTDYLSATLNGVASLCEATISKGTLDGEALCKQAQSDNVRYQMTFKDGALDGTFKVLDQSKDANPVSTFSFKSGLVNGKQEIFSPKNHKLVYRVTWENGSANSEEEGYDENTGNRTLVARYVGGKLEGDMIMYAPDGKLVIYKASFVGGLKHGTEDKYSEATGKPLLHGQWANGKEQGQFKLWNEQGELTDQFIYDNGILVSLLGRGDTPPGQSGMPAAQVDACVDTWVAAFRKANGEEAPISSDQLGEWNGWCKAGKRP